MRKLLALTAMAASLTASTAFATPSTQVWIPSTDVQSAGKSHYGLDVYAPAEQYDGGGWASPIVVQGLTYGLPAMGKVGIEVGVDLKAVGADSHPVYFNVKAGVPEGTLFDGAPSFAFGGYDFGQTEAARYNIVYGLAAKTLGSFGRISAGFFTGNEDLLGKEEDSGLLLSWDRTLTEISPRLWAGMDYQEGESGYGAFSLGVSWAFSENVSVIYGYDAYNNDALPSTYTVQLDLNF